ncbi:C-C motif chemokine 19a.1 [Trichomycterus rosablanca]|uniref:C-C motif chemokine 19a.1 n=1 Tax=Trichomycterus rosablanca TaxID=2290929 RepID=UPI002F34FCAE
MMAQMGITSLCVAVCIIGLILSSNLDVTVGEQALDCCLKVSHHKIPKKIVSCYHEQLRGDGCYIDAVVFRTRKGRDLCAPPNADWVSDLMDAVDARPKKKSKVKHCEDMKFKPY